MIKIVFWLTGSSDEKTRYINAIPDSVHVLTTAETARYRDDIRVTDVSWMKQKDRRDVNWLTRIRDAMRTGEETTFVIRNLHDIYNAIEEDERDRYPPDIIREIGIDRVRAEIMHESESKRRQFLQSLGTVPEPVVLFYNVYPRVTPAGKGFFMILERMVDEIEITWLEND